MSALNSGTVTRGFVVATIFVNVSLSAVGRRRTSFADIFEIDFLDILTDLGWHRTRGEQVFKFLEREFFSENLLKKITNDKCLLKC
jgi:hypothetical protein